MDYKALMDAKKVEDEIKESKLSLTKKIEEALELINSWPESENEEELVKEIKKILEK